VAREALAEPVGPVVLADPGVRVELVAQVALAAPVVPVVLAVLVVPAALENQAVPELVLVGAARGLVQVAAAARIKSATAAHRHGQVRVPKRAEDLAAVAAATMHAPAVTEVATAWAVAE
jgi:hypothetical protein